MTCRKCLETSEYWQILVSLPWQIFQGRLTKICQYYTKKPTKLSAGLHSVSLDRKKCGLAFWVYLAFSRLRLTLLDPFGVLQGQIQPLEGQINSKISAPHFSGREKTLCRPAKNHYLCLKIKRKNVMSPGNKRLRRVWTTRPKRVLHKNLVHIML